MKTGPQAPRPRAVMLSKRANVFYLEHARVLQKDDRVVYLTERGDEIERFFNIPEKNTAFLLLGKGTSITDAAARKLAESNVIVGFCGSGGSPLFGMVDVAFMTPQSEYRPTQYMQAWVRAWFDEARRLDLGKQLMRARMDIIRKRWKRDAELLRKGVDLPEATLATFEAAIAQAASGQDLLLGEAAFAKALYRALAQAYRLSEFTREEGKGAKESKADRVNGFLDHGNYIAYGFAAVTLNGLGISFSLPLLHGKTRRGALVFDIADLVKDAYVMPHAFSCGSAGIGQTEFRQGLIETFQDDEVLDEMFRIVEILCEKSQS
jgi:CRISP-associated protein Cas1